MDVPTIMASAPHLTVAILCGGLGIRLGTLTRDVPKPMIDVGRPFLEHVLQSFTARGLTDLVLLTGFHGEQIEAHFGDGAAFGAHIAYSREEQPIGTGGAVQQARALLGDRFLLTYGDVLRRFDYDRFVNAHEACLAVYEGAGNTAVANGHVTRYAKDARLPYVDAGFCVVPSTVVDFLAPTGSFEEIVFPRLAAAGQFEAEIVNHDFVEIGTPEALRHARTVLS